MKNWRRTIFDIRNSEKENHVINCNLRRRVVGKMVSYWAEAGRDFSYLFPLRGALDHHVTQKHNHNGNNDDDLPHDDLFLDSDWLMMLIGWDVHDVRHVVRDVQHDVRHVVRHLVEHVRHVVDLDLDILPDILHYYSRFDCTYN